MLKAKVKDQLLARAIAFMWTHTGKTERMVFMAKNGVRSDLRVYNFSWQECTTVLLADVCYACSGGSRTLLLGELRYSRWGVSKGGLGHVTPEIFTF